MLFLIVSILLIALSIAFLKRDHSTIKYPPGPFTLPYIGSAWAFGYDTSHLHITLTNLAKKYGKVYRLVLGKQHFVVISDADLIRETFMGTDPPVLLRFVSKTAKIAHKGQSLFTATDRHFWSVMRKLCSPITRNLGIPTNKIVTGELSKLLKESERKTNTSEGVHLNPLFMFYTRNVFLRILIGSSWSYETITAEQQQFGDSFKVTLAKRTNVLDFMPELDFLRGKSRNEALQAYSFLSSFIRRMIEEKKKSIATHRGEAHPMNDLLGMMLVEKEQYSEVTDDSVLATIRSVFVAATATSADTLDWMILFLCTNPEVQEKCYRELRDKLNGRAPTMDDQEHLPYLDGVIKETFRLRPPAPLSLLHVAERDFTVGGYQVQKDSVVVQNLYGIGNMEENYENSSKFDPERWQRNPELVSNLLHFGCGPAACLGMSIAKQEVFLAAANLLQKFKFTISPTSPTPDFDGEFKVVFNPKLWYTSISQR